MIRTSIDSDVVYFAASSSSVEATRMAGARLSNTLISMATDVIEEEDTAPISLKVESLQLEGLLYQGEIYRLIESFAISHRLQAFCIGQTLSEQTISYLITRSTERFAVWVNIRALPRDRYRHHLPSVINRSDLG